MVVLYMPSHIQHNQAWLGVGIVFVSMFLRIYYQQKNKSAKKAAKAAKPVSG